MTDTREKSSTPSPGSPTPTSTQAAAAAPVSESRIVPASVNGRQISIECPSWCVTDHVAENERYLEDIEHSGELFDLVIPGGSSGYRLLAHARLGADLFALDPVDRRPVVVVDDGSMEFRLTPAEALQHADRLIAHGEQMRELARRAAA
ncbi:DUF6907 domain-containing protein [Streptomyces sp. NPDC058066]|uniref:DUF6907 domain-containing protein n=1 Tax=Streptomyces sp. NPDC058066 TaxID=3346323 RepID=UPI0036E5180B